MQQPLLLFPVHAEKMEAQRLERFPKLVYGHGPNTDSGSGLFKRKVAL